MRIFRCIVVDKKKLLEDAQTAEDLSYSIF
jgi:hypothetical protein